jgi:hypothetical protein
MNDIFDFITDPELAAQAFDDADNHGFYNPITDSIKDVENDDSSPDKEFDF